MAHTVAIIGSFQKYYNEILSIIRVFKKVGLCVLSPNESYITDKIGDFVIFESDKKDFSPAEIQMITLDKIIRADMVYVYNPNGYVGKTTCYEIGFCFSKKKPIYFFDYPDDLPIPVIKNKQVLKPEEFAYIAFSSEAEFITDYSFCTDGEKAFNDLFDLERSVNPVKAKKIVICGSMMFFKEMVNCQNQLKKLGIESIVPKEENEAVGLYDERQFMEFKKKVSRTYLKKIRDKETMGVLIYNAKKRGIDNYIGANTLVELAMAFTWNRKIFLFNDIYSPLKDELMAWDCICLNGDLNKLKGEFIKENMVLEEPTDSQLSLFEFI